MPNCSRLLFFVLLFIFFVPAAKADDKLLLSLPDRLQSEPQTSSYEPTRLNVRYFQDVVSDTKHMLASPVHWDERDWSVAAVVLSVTTGLYAYDQDLRNWSQLRRNKTTDHLAELFTPFGNSFYVLPAAGLIYLYGDIQESEKARRIGLFGAESIVLAGAFTGLIKIAAHRHRPDTGDRYNRWDGPGVSTENLSFPSWHASTAFALATVLAEESGNLAVQSAAYGIASVVALSRVNDDEHWSSDVFLGAAIGYFTARTVLRYHRKKNSSFAVLPDIGSDRYGVLLSYRF